MSDFPIGIPAELPRADTPHPNAALAAVAEQDLIRELHAALRIAAKFYGSQNLAARAIGVSSAMLTRASPGWLAENSATDRLPRPHIATLQKLASCEHERVRQIAVVLLARRGY